MTCNYTLFFIKRLETYFFFSQNLCFFSMVVPENNFTQKNLENFLTSKKGDLVPSPDTEKFFFEFYLF